MNTETINPVDGCLDCKAVKPVRRWALWSEQLGFYRPLPHQTEILYTSKRAAVAARLSGSHYAYQPIQVEIRRRS